GALMVAVTVIVTFAPEASEAMVQGSAAQPPPLTLMMVRLVGVSVTCTVVAVDGPALATSSEYWMVWPWMNGPAVSSVFTTETSAATPIRPALPVLSVLFVSFGSNSSAETDDALSNGLPSMVTVTVMTTFAPPASEAMVQGSAAQPPPLTLVMVRLVGVSVTCTLVAVDGPALATRSEYWIDWPSVYGPAVMKF